MVLTNVELWAADGSSGSSIRLDFDSNNPHTRHLNPFDPRAVPHINSNFNHLSSNGYYGFSYVNAAHNVELNNNNINNNNNNISNINHNNNNNATFNLMTNDVNGINNANETTQQAHALSANVGSSAYAAGHAVNVARCKKRFFVMNDDDNDVSGCTATKNKNYYGNNCEVSAKRCRFDDDFSAQYCNDFFQLPSTQIATQSCLMDTEEGLQQQQCLQQQVDVAMFESNNNNIEKYEHKLNPQLPALSAHQQEQHSQQSQQQHDEPQPQHLYHQQQHYQDTQFAPIKCHIKQTNNSDTQALNSHTPKIGLHTNTKNVLEMHKPNRNSSIRIEQPSKYHDNVVNDFEVDDATLFAELHGGCLHHHNTYFNSTNDFASEDYIAKKAAMKTHLQHDNYNEEF